MITILSDIDKLHKKKSIIDNLSNNNSPSNNFPAHNLSNNKNKVAPGIANIQNTCFHNSAVQLLYRMYDFINPLLNINNMQKYQNILPVNKTLLLLAHMHNTPNHVITREELDQIGIQSACISVFNKFGSQEDAAQYLRAVLIKIDNRNLVAMKIIKYECNLDIPLTLTHHKAFAQPYWESNDFVYYIFWLLTKTKEKKIGQIKEAVDKINNSNWQDFVLKYEIIDEYATSMNTFIMHFNNAAKYIKEGNDTQLASYCTLKNKYSPGNQLYALHVIQYWNKLTFDNSKFIKLWNENAIFRKQLAEEELKCVNQKKYILNANQTTNEIMYPLAVNDFTGSITELLSHNLTNNHNIEQKFFAKEKYDGQLYLMTAMFQIIGNKYLLFQLKIFDNSGIKLKNYNINLTGNLQLSGQTYKLVGMVCHQGTNVDEKHYFACIENNKKWYEHNDSNVREINNISQYYGSAYILLYEAI